VRNSVVLSMALGVLVQQSALAGVDSVDGATFDQALLSSGRAVSAMDAGPHGNHRIKAKILIKASPRVVWETVHAERAHDPDIEYSRVLEQGHNQCLLEQKFCLLPIIGSAVCVMKNVEVPLKRIDYSMIHSDHFKAMDGSWILTSAAEEGFTYLELSTYSDPGLPVPRQFIEAFTAKKLQKRLTNVKRMAEATQSSIAERPER
jgi:hypothetical protein